MPNPPAGRDRRHQERDARRSGHRVRTGERPGAGGCVRGLGAGPGHRRSGTSRRSGWTRGWGGAGGCEWRFVGVVGVVLVGCSPAPRRRSQRGRRAISASARRAVGEGLQRWRCGFGDAVGSAGPGLAFSHPEPHHRGPVADRRCGRVALCGWEPDNSRGCPRTGSRGTSCPRTGTKPGQRGQQPTALRRAWSGTKRPRRARRARSFSVRTGSARIGEP